MKVGERLRGTWFYIFGQQKVVEVGRGPAMDKEMVRGPAIWLFPVSVMNI